MEIIRMGLIRGRHELPVDNYVVDSVADPSDMAAIDRAVRSKLGKVFAPYMRKGTVNIPNATEYVDIPALVSSAELHLYITGLTSVALAVINYCYANGIPVTAWHYDLAKKEYVPQKLL